MSRMIAMCPVPSLWSASHSGWWRWWKSRHNPSSLCVQCREHAAALVPLFLMEYLVVTWLQWSKMHFFRWPCSSCSKRTWKTRSCCSSLGLHLPTDTVVSSPSSINWSSPGIIGVNWHWATKRPASKTFTEPLAKTCSEVFTKWTARFTQTSEALGS